MNKVFLSVFVGAVLVFGGSQADTSLGSCPAVEPMPGFNMQRFLGYWYGIQKTSTAIPCLAYNVTESEDKKGQYRITQVEQHATLWMSSLHHEHHTGADLIVSNPAEPGKMTLDVPLEIGTTKFVVFMTDYYNYAAVFTCKKLPLIHKWTVAIVSRAPTLDMAFVDKVRTRISSYNIDPFTLSVISQADCAAPGAKGSLIQAGLNAIDNVGEKVTGLISENTGRVGPPARAVPAAGPSS